MPTFRSTKAKWILSIGLEWKTGKMAAKSHREGPSTNTKNCVELRHMK
uniref:Uncharacterized protein n=1 Tax=Utricularia reniformis TaxID=192314 RepID=A0A1Y0B3G8_9LAMI|nr:hypothetical protein AEK19_MT1764 [Utricularia reniformis]ART31938.1 hypothetical protein AEK19_MT1764 [Utricularia reniformis]